MVTEKRVRKIVRIDEAKCNGCGDCVPSCAEGAIKIIDGKARLAADNLCDGLGACLGHCPMDAITVEERPADDYDEAAVEKHLGHKPTHYVPPTAAVPAMTPAAPKPAFAPMHAHAAGGCPGSRLRTFEAMPAAQPSTMAGSSQSALRQWPVQLTLLPMQGPIWQDAHLLLAADCVPFAYPDFHSTMLAGKTLAIACPKLDETDAYVQKLATIFANNTVRSVTIARMEVPCCGGLNRIVSMALQISGRTDIPVKEVIVGIRGAVQ